MLTENDVKDLLYDHRLIQWISDENQNYEVLFYVLDATLLGNKNFSIESFTTHFNNTFKPSENVDKPLLCNIIEKNVKNEMVVSTILTLVPPSDIRVDAKERSDREKAEDLLYLLSRNQFNNS